VDCIHADGSISHYYFDPWTPGFAVFYPSCWFLDTSKVRTLPPILGMECPYEEYWDGYMLLALNLQHEVVIGRTISEIYNYHDQNRSTAIPAELHDSRFKDIVMYYQSIEDQLKTRHYVPKDADLPKPISSTVHKILCVGPMVPERHAAGFARALEEKGQQIYRVAVDSNPINTISKSDFYLRYSYPSEKGFDVVTGIQVANIQEVIAMGKFTDIDRIFIFQTPIMRYDLRGVTVPWDYFYDEMSLPTFPLYDQLPQHIFYSFVGGSDLLEFHFRQIWKQIGPVTSFLPYAVDPNLFYPDPHITKSWMWRLRGRPN
jgi:hypothetical protein